MNNNGSGYIESAILVLVFVMVIILAINTFSFFVMYKELDSYAKQILEKAAFDGKTGSNLSERIAELNESTGLSPTLTWEAEYFNAANKTVQLGKTITVTATVTTTFQGIGGFVRIPLTIKSTHSALSRQYHKTGG